MATIQLQEITNVGEDVEKREPLCTVDQNVNWCSTVENSRVDPQKLKIELPYDPALPLLGIYPKETKSTSQRDICTSMFIAALFTIARTWKLPKSLPTDEWINKFVMHIQ